MVIIFSDGDQFTVFVPTDTAFQDLPQDIIDQLMKNKTLLMEALTFHIVKVRYRVRSCQISNWFQRQQKMFPLLI